MEGVEPDPEQGFFVGDGVEQGRVDGRAEEVDEIVCGEAESDVLKIVQGAAERLVRG